MSENLSNSSSSENLVSPPARAPRPIPTPSPRRPTAAPPEEKQTGPITADSMKTGKKVSVTKPLTFKKPGKKKD